MGLSQRNIRTELQPTVRRRTEIALVPATCLRICRFEEMEERKFLAADLHLGAVYFEDASGDDSQGDTIQITFAGGATGTELTKLVIDGDKDGLGPSAGDIFFDTASGGRGVYGSSPLKVVAHDGFEVLGYTVSDGGTSITFDLAGFKAGMKLVFTVDTDEIQTVTSSGEWDVNAIVEGGEFQRSTLQGTFIAPGHETAVGNATFWDAYDDEFAAEAAHAGSVLNLPHDRYSTTHDYIDRTAGAVTSLRQQPLPGSLTGYVHADLDGDCVFDPNEVGLEGVVIQLLDASGNLLRTTLTDTTGHYRFDNLAAGEYQIRELQPAGYIDSGDHPGTLGGDVPENDLISHIHVGPGQHGVEYHFCEIPPAMLSGFVYHDANGSGTKDAGEQGIAGVVVVLKNGTATVGTATTDANGKYQFNNLPPGTYGVYETQPQGWIDGLDLPGTAGGAATNPGDAITGASLTPGLAAENYNFGEVLPSSLRGHVHADLDGDCQKDPGEVGIAGVIVNLYDKQGDLVATTKTDSDGNYHFENLLPGEYTVEEIQPSGYFDGGDFVGSAGGVKTANDTIGEINLSSGQQAIDYNFCEKPPASISGYVFQDGGPIQTGGNQKPNVPGLRDGIRTPDDKPLAGIVLELRDGITGEPIYESSVLGEHIIADKVVTAVTDENGYYEFKGIKAGNYAVYQRQDPAGYIDGINTAGSLGGIVMSAYTTVSGEVLSELQYAPASGDAILRIVVGAGQSSVENNFSEVATTPLIIIVNPPPSPPPTYQPGVYTPPGTPPNYVPTLPQPEVLRFHYGGSTMNYTWHLSVIDAGNPRGDEAAEAQVQQTAAGEEAPSIKKLAKGKARWVLATRDDAGKLTGTRELSFGPLGGIPVTGDFDGDGVSEIAMFDDGQWYLDADGNGEQTPTDLWAKLGGRDDLPVTGDWNGDGKSDIGIYGPAWPRDPNAIRNEPGIADAENTQRDALKNHPPRPQHAALGSRKLRSGATHEREDLIDHVFHYGTAGDVPVAGDWNGDGHDTIGVFRAGTWHRDTNGDGRTTAADIKARFGRAGDRPVVGDWNGDGRDDLGVYREGTWYLDTNGNDQLDAGDEIVTLGGRNDLPITGDFDGDGRDEVGIVAGGRVISREQLTQASGRSAI